MTKRTQGMHVHTREARRKETRILLHIKHAPSVVKAQDLAALVGLSLGATYRRIRQIKKRHPQVRGEAGVGYLYQRSRK
jgi:hypothetical protein